MINGIIYRTFLFNNGIKPFTMLKCILQLLIIKACCLWDLVVTFNQLCPCLHCHPMILKGWMLSSLQKAVNNKFIFQLLRYVEFTINMVDHHVNTVVYWHDDESPKAWWILDTWILLAWSAWQVHEWQCFPSSCQDGQANNICILGTHHGCDGSPLFSFLGKNYASRGRHPYVRGGDLTSFWRLDFLREHACCTRGTVGYDIYVFSDCHQP